MTQQHTDAQTHKPEEEEEDENVTLEGEGGSIEVPRDEVIPRLDELAEAVLPDKDPPNVEAPTEENS